MKPLYTFALVTFALSFASSAHAGVFGYDEEVVEIGQIEGGRLRIGYKTTALYFFAGVYLSNDGYVLIKGDDVASCTRLDDKKIRTMQASGQLPTPMPKYSIGLGRYLWGYSLWVILFLLALIPFVKEVVLKRGS